MREGVREDYARMLNASWMAPTCGTIAKELVRKHLEIPATKACLITEQTAAVEAAGFADMQNCVFADRSTVLDKINHLFRHPEELARITDAGFRLVHARHTAANRDQIYQWFKLCQGLRPTQRIVQTGPFDPLVVVDRASGVTNSHVISGGVDRLLLREGDRKLSEGRLGEAEECYIRCLNYHFIPEPVLGLTRCSLLRGDPARALHWIAKPITASMKKHQAADPDPVEWAWFAMSLLCQGSLSEATRRARQFPSLHHLELERARAVIDLLNDGSHDTGSDLDWRACGRCSVHQLPARSFADWVKELCGMLEACRQGRLANALIGALSRPGGGEAKRAPEEGQAPGAQRAATGSGTPDAFPLIVEPPRARLRRQLRSAVKSVLRRLEAPRSCAPGSDGEEVCHQIQRLAREEQITTALVVGGPRSARSTEAFLEGLQENPSRPSVFSIGRAGGQKIERREIVKLKEDGRVDHFGMVLLDGAEAGLNTDLDEIFGADLILFTGVNRYAGHLAYVRLLEAPSYQLVTHDPTQYEGFAVFRKLLYPPHSLSHNRCEA